MMLFRNVVSFLLVLVWFSFLFQSAGNAQVEKNSDEVAPATTIKSIEKRGPELPPANQVIDRYIQRLGGYEVLESRQNLHQISLGTTSRGEEFVFESYQAEGKFHSQFTYGDGRIRERNVRTDGSLTKAGIRAGVAWEKVDGSFIRVMQGAELQEYIRRRTFVSSVTTLLDNYKSIECQSVEEVNNELTYKIHLVDHDATVVDLYFSIDTGLLMRRVAMEEFDNSKHVVTRDRFDWEKLGDTMISRNQIVSWSNVEYRYKIETYEVDIKIPNEIFETPQTITKLSAEIER